MIASVVARCREALETDAAVTVYGSRVAIHLLPVEIQAR
jgi:hypothetical protein